MWKKILLACALGFFVSAPAVYLLWPVLEAERKTAEARKKFAFQSLEDRLPKGKAIALPAPLSPAAAKRWEIIEEKLEQIFVGRAILLKALHERTRKFFVESPGAGAERGGFTHEDILLDDWGTDPKQPGPPSDFPVSAGEPLTLVAPKVDHFLYHEGNMTNFLNPSGFGYVKDRGHVAGFKPHGFRGFWQYHDKPLKIDRIQLVGILMHDEPVVYLTDGLPSMEAARHGKVRELDPFEERGLDALRKGDDLFIASKGERLRMMGALRATKQCLLCHDANRGDLLGALSYTLRSETPEPR